MALPRPVPIGIGFCVVATPSIAKENAMKRFTFLLLGAVGAFFVLSPAQAADFRVIQWNVTKFCQVYDMGWGKPIPSNFTVLTKKPLPTWDAAHKAKIAMAKSAGCSF
jgi:hypothetical protein